MSPIRRRGLKVAGITLLPIALLVALPATALADSAQGESMGLPREELQFILNTFAFLIWGALVMWMCAGFTMLESGAVRTKNASMICLKNIGIYSIAGLAYYFVGYNLMYVDVGDVIGSFQFLYGPSDAELGLLDGAADHLGEVVGNGYAVMSDWFFQ
ncbi:MAG: ammonium transporter, partial [Acidimicrobiaceae bacterium]|nr:ammonium transporter [Acidimicrobiaceae bacterium]